MSGAGILYLTGCTNDKIEPALIEQGIGLLVQPGSGYANRIPRFGFHGVDNGCFNPATYIGDDKYLNFVDRLPRDRCLFVAVPDVARRPDGTLGGDPVATWRRFQEMGPLVQEMGFPAALVAQNGIEHLPNLREQLEACDALFLGGSTDWKLGLAAEQVTALARNLGKWVHMGRCNSFKRYERARAIGCNSVDGTYIGFGPDTNLPKLVRWIVTLEMQHMFPLFHAFEAPSHPTHRAAHTSGGSMSTSGEDHDADA